MCTRRIIVSLYFDSAGHSLSIVLGQFLAGLATWYSEAFGSLCYNNFEYVEFHVWNQRIFFREGKTFFLIKRKNVFPSLKPILFKKEKCIIKNIIIISAVKFNLSDFTAFFFINHQQKGKNYEDININHFFTIEI